MAKKAEFDWHITHSETELVFSRTIDGCDLIETCGACPEQYDVYLDGAKIGYLRLRGGYFRADYLHSGGRTLYEAFPKGDGLFESDERDFYLNEAVRIIKAYHEAQIK